MSGPAEIEACHEGGEMARVSFGTRLRSLRERAGLTHTELAVAVGVSQGNIATWERNAAVPEIAMVERLAVFLGVSLVELLIGQPPNQFIPIKPRKVTIRLTADKLRRPPFDRLRHVTGQGVNCPSGIDIDDFIVSKLIAWVELESGKSPDVKYELSRLVTAVLLERLASQQ